MRELICPARKSILLSSRGAYRSLHCDRSLARAVMLSLFNSSAAVGYRMCFGAAAIGVTILCFSTLLAPCVHAEDIDTEHLFGFMIGTDVGSLGEREFQSQTTGRLSRAGGNYRAINHELELEFVPTSNFRIEVGSSFAAYDINGVPGFEDRRQLNWQGVS